MDDELLLAVAELVEALEGEKTSIEESDFIARLDRARKELELAKISVGCSLCKREIDELIEKINEKADLLKKAQMAYTVMQEQGIERSWFELDEEMRRKIKEEVRRRLRLQG